MGFEVAYMTIVKVNNVKPAGFVCPMVGGCASLIDVVYFCAAALLGGIRTP
jgi:hypothetical protein